MKAIYIRLIQYLTDQIRHLTFGTIHVAINVCLFDVVAGLMNQLCSVV